MPFDSDKFLKIAQFNLLLDHLEILRVINAFERDTLKKGKRPPPRVPGPP